MKTILVLDTNYLCHRALYTTGHLSYDGEATGVIYGVLETVRAMQERFDADQLVWTFDHGPLKRVEIYPAYKANRYSKPLSDIERSNLQEFREQVRDLENKHLPDLGYRNVFSQKGYEADDVIASVVSGKSDCNFIVVSADKDLWQLLTRNVSCYNPALEKLTTENSFMEEWGFYPGHWINTKAIAGDSSDNILGIKGVGLKTAAKYLRGELALGSKAYQSIGNGIGIINRNVELIRLPYPGTEQFELQEDKLTEAKRETVYRRLGFQVERRVRGVKPKKEKVSQKWKGFFE